MRRAFILTFRTVHHVLKIEKLLKERGFIFELVPTSLTVQGNCGISIKLQEVDACLTLCREFIGYEPSMKEAED